MPRPEKSILQQFEESRNEGNIFQTQRDIDAQNRWIKEQVESLGAEVVLALTSTVRGPGDGPGESAGVDPLYGDILDPQWFERTAEEEAQRKYNMRCLLDHAPSKQLLKRYGIEETRDVIFHFPFERLEEKGMVTKDRFRGIDIGDFVVWDGSWYIALSTHRESYHGNTVSHYFTSISCKRYAPNSVPTESTPAGEGC